MAEATHAFVVQPTHAFVGYATCGHAEFLYVDLDLERASDDADIARATIDADLSMLEGFVACLRAGGSIKRIPLDEARATRLCCGMCVRGGDRG